MTVSGSGTPANPYVVSVGAVDCSQVRPCISAGQGATYSPASGIVSAQLSTAPNNLVEFGPDGGLFVETDCAQVRTCFTEGNGIDYDPTTGIIAARPSTDSGNNLAFGGDGGLYVPTGAATVSTACGLTGNGAAATPLTVATGAWPYPCSVDTEGGIVACGTDGVLRGEPRPRVAMFSRSLDTNYPNVAVPAATNQFVEHFEDQFTNPDPCRSAIIIAERELEVTFNLPPGAGAEYGFNGPDETVYHVNTGSSAENGFHVQTTKVLPQGTALPGQTVTVGFDALVGRGSGGATYNHVQFVLRVLFISV